MKTLRSSALSALLAAGACHAGDFWFQTTPLVTQRLDPIMQSGQMPSDHVHVFATANGLQPEYSAASQSKSTCTSTDLPGDLSAYWWPALYYHWPNGSFSLIESSLRVAYLDRKEKNETLVPHPNGLKMIAGNPGRRVAVTTDPNRSGEKAVQFSCEGAPTSYNFPANGCKGRLYTKLIFPACWDGVNLMKPDLSHLAWPIGDPERGFCPRTHPKRLYTIQFDIDFRVDNYPYRKGAWVFSYGDNEGFGYHSDVITHWKGKLLQQTIDQCKTSSSVETCPPLAAIKDTAQREACRPLGTVINENPGRTSPISRLLGDNPVWSGTGSKPSCNCAIPTPGWISPNSTLSSGFKVIGCIEEGSSGRVFSGASTTATDMTGAKCTAFCAQKGFTHAGTEYGQECYCGNAFANGGSGKLVDWRRCFKQCPGNTMETCGGDRVLTFYQKTSKKRHVDSKLRRL